MKIFFNIENKNKYNYFNKIQNYNLSHIDYKKI